MDDTKMAIKYWFNGKWKHVASKGWTYSGGSLRIVSMSKKALFHEMKGKIYEQLGIDPLGYKLEIKMLYTSVGIDETVPVDIYDDNTWVAYLCEKLEKEPMKLCVVAKEGVTFEPPIHMSNVRIDLNEDVVDLRDDNPVQCCQAEVLSPRVPEFYPIDNVREESDPMADDVFFDTDCVDDDTVGEVPHASYTELVVGGSSQSLNDSVLAPTVPVVNPGPNLVGGQQSLDTMHNAPPTMNCSVPTIRGVEQFGAHHSETQHAYGGSSSQGGIDVGDFGDGLPEMDITPCPSTGTINAIDENGVYVGRMFRDKDEVRETMTLHALRNGYEFSLDRSDKKKFRLICKHDERCNWELVARKVCGGEDDEDVRNFKITRYNEKHECGLRNVTNEHAQATPSVISNIIRTDVVKLKGKYRARNVEAAVSKEFGISINYDKAYRSLQETIRMIGGTPEQSYGKLVKYFHMVEQANAHSLTDVVQDELGRFKFAFMSLRPSIEGFKYCRPVLCVDGAHLKTKYKGTLFVAVGVDAGDHLFPLAIGVAAGEECNESWTYFFDHLKKAIGEREDIGDLVFVSDRHQAIKSSLEKVFPKAHHGICYHHLLMNVNKEFGAKRYCPVTLHQAAYACSVQEFDILFARIKQQDEEVYDYLVKAGVEYWARSHFPGTRYAIMTNNYAESLNAILLEARKMTITNMFEYFRKTLQRWYHQRRELAYNCRCEMAPEVEKELKTTVESRKQFMLEPIDVYEYQVVNRDSNCRVNLLSGRCYYGKFQTYKLPCEHAAAAVAHRRWNIYDFCGVYYKAGLFKNIYAGRVFPVPPEKHWKIPDIVGRRCVLPPSERDIVSGERIRKGKKRGRRATKRIRSNGERTNAERSARKAVVGKIIRRCSICKDPTYKKNKCPTPLSLG